MQRFVARPSGNGPQQCAVCGAALIYSARYPDRLCDDCVARAVDGEGRRLEFGNTDISGGFMAVFAENGERAAAVERDHIVFVDGRRCRADEAHFGGIVVVPDVPSP